MRNYLTTGLHSWILIPLMSISVHAQELKRDSLLSVLQHVKEDTNKVKLYLEIAELHAYNQMDSAIYFCERARDLSARLDYKRGMIRYMLDRQHLMNIQGQFDSALSLCVSAANLAREISDQRLLASALGNTGSVYLYTGDKRKAVEYYLQCAEILERLGDKKKLSTLYTNLGINYQRLKQHQEALKYGEKAIALSRELNDRPNLGIALTNHAVTLMDMNNKPAALPYLEEALAISRETNFMRLQLSALINIAGVLENHSAEKQKFKTYIEEALRLSEQLDEKTGLAISLRSLGSYFFYEGNLEKAKDLALQSLKITREFRNPEDEQKALMLLSYISVAAKDMKSYEMYRLQSDTLRNRLVNEDLAKNIKELEVKYDTNKKESQIQGLEHERRLQAMTIRQKNMLNGILTGVVLIIFITGALLYRNYRQRQELQRQAIRELQTERRLLATDAALKVQEVERARLAKDLHDGLGGMLSGVRFSFDAIKDNLLITPESQTAFARCLEMLDTSITELRRVAHNMMPVSLAKTGLLHTVRDFCADIERKDLHVIYQEYGLEDVHFNQTLSITVYRIIQELLNNVLKHAQATEVIVQLSYHNPHLQITVEDNGKGFNKDQISASKGMGGSNVQSRVDYLRGSIDVQSVPGKGTSITITLPV